MKLVHLIDDDSVALLCLEMFLGFEGFTTAKYNSALAFLSDNPKSAGCVVTDIDMPGMSGLELAAEMPKRGIDCPVIVMTGHCSAEKKRRAHELGVFDYLEKPIDPQTLVADVLRALA